MTKQEYLLIPVYSRSGVVGYTKVDKEDEVLVNSRKWFLNIKKYVSYGVVVDKKYSKVFLHRLLIPCDKDQCVDHINGDTLDNRKSNLRVASNLQNQMNKRGYKNRSSKYKGVTWGKEAKKWEVRVMLNGKQHFVGRFKNELDAAKAYNQKSKELFGEFAYQNQIDL